MKVAFLGTPEFALPTLNALIDDGHELCVFTQPDKLLGRKRMLTAPPVKLAAIEHGLPVYQFNKIKSAKGVETLTQFGPDFMVTAAFGQILSAEVLAIPKYGCINVHASLLPRYRGAAPIQSAIVAGERVTGVTTMLTDVGLDTGDILLKAETPIGNDETAGELTKRLANIGATLLIDTLDGIVKGSIKPMPQDAKSATKCGLITKQSAKIDFGKTAAQVHDLVRGMNPEPCAYAIMDGQQVNIWRTALTGIAPQGAPGECIIANPKEGLFIATADGTIEVTELQFSGAKRMSAKVAMNGKNLKGRMFS